MSERKPIQVVEVFSEIQEVCDNALAQIEAGDLLSAEMEAERLYHLHPDDHMVNFLHDICCIQREFYQEAISFFETAIQINPWFCEAYFNLASLYRQASALFDEAFACLRREEHQKAISLFQQVLELNPNHVQSYGNMALAHSALSEQKIALQHLDKALSLDPTYEPAQQTRENIIRLKEGEQSPFKMAEVLYYKEKLELEGKERQKPRALTWSNAAIGYVHQNS